MNFCTPGRSNRLSSVTVIDSIDAWYTDKTNKKFGTNRVWWLKSKTTHLNLYAYRSVRILNRVQIFATVTKSCWCKWQKIASKHSLGKLSNCTGADNRWSLSNCTDVDDWWSSYDVWPLDVSASLVDKLIASVAIVTYWVMPITRISYCRRHQLCCRVYSDAHTVVLLGAWLIWLLRSSWISADDDALFDFYITYLASCVFFHWFRATFVSLHLYAQQCRTMMYGVDST